MVYNTQNSNLFEISETYHDIEADFISLSGVPVHQQAIAESFNLLGSLKQSFRTEWKYV